MAVQAKSTDAELGGSLTYITREEALEFFDRMAQFTLKISGEEFVRRFNAGEYEGEEDESGVRTMIGLLPMIRD